MSEERPIVLTCVTAVYNAVSSGNRDRLVRMAESIASLKTPHEHLLIDGASDDGTVELLAELAARIPGIRLTSERDTGIYNALNKGLAAARGEWFYVLGCDDYIAHPESMDRLLATAGDEEIIATPVPLEGGTERMMSFRHERDLKYLFERSVCCHQGEIARTAALRRLGGFDERYRISADTDLFLRAHLAGCAFRYSEERFAVFHLGGTADSHVHEFRREDALSICRALGMGEREAAYYRRTRTVPPRIAKSLLTHSDLAVRLAAKRMLRRRALHLALLDPFTWSFWG